MRKSLLKTLAIACLVAGSTQVFGQGSTTPPKTPPPPQANKRAPGPPPGVATPEQAKNDVNKFFKKLEKKAKDIHEDRVEAAEKNGQTPPPPPKAPAPRDQKK